MCPACVANMGVHRGERGVHQRIGRGRREKGLIEVAGKIIKRRKR
jgi:hypothetical protein